MIKKALFLFVVFNIAVSAYCGRMFTKPDGSVWIVTNTITRNIVVSVNGNVGIGISNPECKLHVDGSVCADNYITGGPFPSVTNNYTIDLTDSFIFANAVSGNITITLPTAASSLGQRFDIKKVDSTGNLVTVDPNGSETIDDELTMIINCQYNNMSILSNGIGWVII